MSKKYCTRCGCIMDQNHDGDICEVCLDELYESDPGEDESEDWEDVIESNDLEDQLAILLGDKEV